jgi:hypothetical protein
VPGPLDRIAAETAEELPLLIKARTKAHEGHKPMPEEETAEH